MTLASLLWITFANQYYTTDSMGNPKTAYWSTPAGVSLTFEYDTYLHTTLAFGLVWQLASLNPSPIPRATGHWPLYIIIIIMSINILGIHIANVTTILVAMLSGLTILAISPYIYVMIVIKMEKGVGSMQGPLLMGMTGIMEACGVHARLINWQHHDRSVTPSLTGIYMRVHACAPPAKHLACSWPLCHSGAPLAHHVDRSHWPICLLRGLAHNSSPPAWVAKRIMLILLHWYCTDILGECTTSKTFTRSVFMPLYCHTS